MDEWREIILCNEKSNMYPMAALEIESGIEFSSAHSFEKIVINRTLPTKTIHIGDKDNLYQIDEGIGNVGNIFLRTNDLCIPIQSTCLNNYTFVSSTLELYSQSFLKLSSETIVNSSIVLIKFCLNPEILSCFNLAKKKAKIRLTMQKHLRILLMNLIPSLVTPVLTEDQIQTNFMKIAETEKFLHNFKHKSSPFLHISKIEHIETDRLNLTLFPYQRNTIEWMLQREKYPEKYNDHEEIIFTKITAYDESVLYYHNYLGILTDKTYPISHGSMPGGILAEEVGLGKTIEILALIISHKNEQFRQNILSKDLLNLPENNCNKNHEDSFVHSVIERSINRNEHPCTRCQSYVEKNDVKALQKLTNNDLTHLVCSDCLQLSDSFDCKTTLIVCPTSLLNQWQDEIKCRFNKPRPSLLIYNGVKDGFIHPYILSTYDIILTNYSILINEFYHSGLFIGDFESKDLRHEKRYSKKITPLTYLKFWRIVYDESQVVECKSGTVSKMCCYIKSINRWCVTGTPLHRNLDDIEGLFALINYHPYCDHDHFKLIFYHDLSLNKLDSLITVLCKIMRRTEKDDVEHELKLPDISYKVISLDFDPVELHYYLDYQQRNCLKISKWSKILDKLNNSEKISVKSFKRLLSEFTILRQLCSNPFHLLSKKVKAANDLSDATYSIDEAMQKLIEVKRKECEELNRSIIFYRNGLACIYIFKNDIDSAIKFYEDSVQMWNQNQIWFNTDKLQKIHVLHNLINVSKMDHKEYKNTLNTLIKEYMEKSSTEMTSTKSALNSSISFIQQIENKTFNINISFSSLLSKLSKIELNDTIQKIVQNIQKEGLTDSPFSSNFDIKTLKSYLDSKYCEIQNSFSEIIDLLSLVESTNTKSILKKSKKCCLADISISEGLMDMGNKVYNLDCSLCSVENKLNDLEKMLYVKTSQDKKNKELKSMTGFRGKTEADVIVKVLSGNKQSVHFEAYKNLKLWLNEMKKCFDSLRNYFISLRTWFFTQDEVKMCCRRMSLKDFISRNTFGLQVEELMNLEVTNNTEQINECVKSLEIHLTQLKYFLNLSQAANKASFNTEPCPICYEGLGNKWIVFICSHFLCFSCYERYKNTHERSKHLECPLCRYSVHFSDTFIVRLNSESTSKPLLDTTCPTKISHVCSTVLDIISSTRNDKIIIFSEWNSIIDLCFIQLKKKEIKACYATSITQLLSQLPIFFESSAHRVLLMNLRLGSKGITITAANHIIFADVCLNLQDEIQAIGRCHRIGQKKQIKVYHFMMKMSIEEKVYSVRLRNDSVFPLKRKKTLTNADTKKFLEFNQD